MKRLKTILKKHLVLFSAAAVLMQGLPVTVPAAGIVSADSAIRSEIQGQASGISADGVLYGKSPVSGNDAPLDNTVSKNSVPDDALSKNSISGNSSAEPEPEEISDHSTADEENVSASVNETVSFNETVSSDVISENDISEHPMGYIQIDTPDPGRVMTDPLYKGDQGEEAAGVVYPSKYAPVNDLMATRSQTHGTCWTYGTQAMVEGDLIRSGYADKSVDTSELHVAYFSSWYNKGVTDPLEGTEGDTTTFNGSDYLENGGNYVQSVQPLANWTGSVNQNDVTDEGKATSSTKLAAGDQYGIDKYHVQGIYSIPTAEIDTMKKYIYEHGAVGGAYYDSDGYYNSTYNSYYCSSAYNTNHAISIVGWDDDFSASKFNSSPSGDGAWLIRNSWSTNSEYSHYGYFWMSYYDKSLYETSYALDAEPASNYDNNYQYDGDTIYSDKGQGGYGQIYGANIFEIKANDGKNESLEAVSFETYNTTNADYEIKVYRDLTDEKDPESGTLCGLASGNTQTNGYYTVKLDNPVELKYGSKFSVVVKLVKDGQSVYLAKEDSYSSCGWLNKTVSSKSGQSYYRTSDSGSFTSTGTSGNIRIKAFTKNTSNSGNPDYPEGELVGIKVEAARAQIKVGQTTTVTATPVPSDADLKDVTWSSSDTAIATVDAEGRVTAAAPGEALIIAKSGGITGKTTITVTDNVITYIALNESSLIMDKGDKSSLIVSVRPGELSSEVTWTSSDTSVAVVDNGTVTAVAPGEADIRVRAKDSKALSAVCSVTVRSSQVVSADEICEDRSEDKLWIGNIADAVYTGEALKPAIRVYDGNIMLKEGKDYTLAFKNNKAVAGKDDEKKAPSVTVSFKGNYKGKLIKTFNIVKASLADDTEYDDMVAAYTGKKIKFTPVLVNNKSGMLLKDKSDFTYTVSVSGGNAVNEVVDAGDYTVKVVPGSNGYYDKEAEFTLSVKKGYTDVSRYSVKVTNNTYTDDYSDLNPVYTVKEGKNTVAKSRYSMSEPVINDKGQATVIMSGVPEKKTCGTKLIKFKVTQKKVDITGKISPKLLEIPYYTKGGCKPKVQVIYNDGTVLREGVDYTVIYKNNNKVYTYGSIRKSPYYIIKGKGKYTGTDIYRRTFKINPKDISKLTVAASDIPWSKSKNFYKKPKVTIYDTNGKKLSGSDFKVTVEDSGNTPDIGDTLWLTVEGKGNYTGLAEDVSCRIIDPSKNLAKAKITIGSTYTYTGKQISVEDVKVTLNNAELGSDCYEIAGYAANLSTGNASVTIRGKNGYGGEKTQKFRINAKAAQ